jgi:hypothetical protein
LDAPSTVTPLVRITGILQVRIPVLNGDYLLCRQGDDRRIPEIKV